MIDFVLNSTFFYDAAKILITAGLAVLGTHLAARYSSRISDRRLQEERQRKAEHLAVSVVCALDPFITACASVAYDTGAADAEGYRETTTSVPTVSIPADVDWTTIPQDMAYRIRSLPNSVARINEAVAQSGSIATPPDYEEVYDTRREGYARLGLKVLALANEIRAAYKLPPAEHADEDNASLQTALADVLRERQEAIERHAESMKFLEAAGLRYLARQLAEEKEKDGTTGGAGDQG